MPRTPGTGSPRTPPTPSPPLPALPPYPRLRYSSVSREGCGDVSAEATNENHELGGTEKKQTHKIKHYGFLLQANSLNLDLRVVACGCQCLQRHSNHS